MRNGFRKLSIGLVVGVIALLLTQAAFTSAPTDEEYVCWRVPKSTAWSNHGSPDADWGKLDFILRNKKKWTYQAVRGQDYFLHKNGKRRLPATQCNSESHTIKRDYIGLRDICGFGRDEVSGRTRAPRCPRNFTLDGNYCYENGVSPAEREDGKRKARCPKGYDLYERSKYDKLVGNPPRIKGKKTLKAKDGGKSKKSKSRKNSKGKDN